MKKIVFFLLVSMALLPSSCKNHQDMPPDNPETPVAQISADANQDGVIAPEDDLNNDGLTDEKDEKVLGLILFGLEEYRQRLDDLHLKAGLQSLERWESDQFAASGPEVTVLAVELAGPAGHSGYLVWVINKNTIQAIPFGMVQVSNNQAIFFDAAHPEILRTNLDTYQTVLADDSGDGDYWECAGDCVKDALDGFEGSLCASICAVCIVEPSKVSCAGCLVCLGSVVAGCLIWCAW